MFLKVTTLQNGLDIICNVSDHQDYYNMNETVSYPVNSSSDALNYTDISYDAVIYLNTVLPHKSSKYNEQNDVIVKVIAMSVVIVMGLFGNVMVIYSIVSNRRLHRPPFYYLISLSISDLSRAVFCLPFVLASAAQGSIWRHGESACTLLAFANTFFVFSSAVSLMAIAVDRHLAIVYTHFHRRRSQGLLNLAIVILGWLVSFAVSFPPVFGMGTYKYIQEESQCAFKHKRYRRNDTLGFVLVFTAVIIATFFLYARIFIFLRDHRKMRPFHREPPRSNNWTFFGPGANAQVVINWLNGMPLGPPAQMPTITQNLSRSSGRVVNLRARKNEHLSRIFFIVTVVFNSLWIPYLVQAYVIIFGTGEKLPTTVLTITAWLTYVQVGLCPFVYIFCNGPLRRESKPSSSQQYGRISIPME